MKKISKFMLRLQANIIKPASIMLLLAVVVGMLACKGTGDAQKQKRHDEKSRPLVYLDVKRIDARTRDEPAKAVIIDLTLGVRGGVDAAGEIEARYSEIAEQIKSAIRERHHFELYSVDDYERLHVVFKDAINRILKNGTVEKVLFRNFDVRR